MVKGDILPEKKNAPPLISVIVPCYNGEKYLKESIDSVLGQTCDDFELIILNDGSNDNTEDIILSYEDKRIRYIRNEENLGLIKTLNKGLDLAKGEFIARMDQDDICLPERFEQQIKVFESNPEIGLCGTGFQLFGNRDELIIHPQDHENIKIDMLFYCPIAHPTVMFRKTAIEKHRYDENYQAAEDYELWIRLVRCTKFHNIQKPLLLYRWHNENMSIIRNEKQIINSSKILGRQLKYLGIESSKENIHLCHKFNIRIDRPTAGKDLKRLIKFSNMIELHNKTKNYYDSQKLHENLQNKLVRFWGLLDKKNAFLILYILKYRSSLLVAILKYGYKKK